MTFNFLLSSYKTHLVTALCAAIALFTVPQAHAQAGQTVLSNRVKTEHVTATLVAQSPQAKLGQPFYMALNLEHIPHWHTYWRNAGDSGLPTKIEWQLPAGFSAGPIVWPAPKRLPFGPLLNFGYEDQVALPVLITPPASFNPANDKATIKASASWLVCKDVCIPEEGEFTLTLGKGQSANTQGETWITQALAQAPKPASSWSFAAQGSAQQLALNIKPAANFTPARAEFFPYTEGVLDNPAAQPLQAKDGAFELGLKLVAAPAAGTKTLQGVLVARDAQNNLQAIEIDAPLTLTATSSAPAAPTGSSASTSSAPAALAAPVIANSGSATANTASLWTALMFALLGGLILNLMPCVLPVLSIKIMGFVAHANGQRNALIKQGLMFLAGVLASFWALAGLMLALREGGQAIGWGFQLQSPGFVVALSILFTLMALNFAGVFEIGAGLQGAATNAQDSANGRGPMAESFIAGVLTTLVATPCTAPFLGAGIGFTLTQSVAQSMLIFTAMALGVGLPVALLAMFPNWLKRVPKPGAWMNTLKTFFAFPMLGTVVWLVWVLGQQRGNDAVMQLLAGLVVIALAAWIYGRYSLRSFAPTVVISALVALGGTYLAWPSTTANAVVATAPTAQTQGEWQPYSTAKVNDLVAQGKPVFIDFTAAWCISCQVNKKVALNQPEVQAKFKALGVTTFKADWTNRDPEITAALAAFGRNAVPLYVLYGPDKKAHVLPELLTPALVLESLDRATASAAKADKVSHNMAPR